MRHSSLNSRWVLSNIFHGILLLCMSSSLESAAAATSANETDQLALLDFKNLILQDPNQILRSWNDSIHFCNWFGVSCNPSNGRVITLNLNSQSLVGSIPPSIGNLTYLTGINLRNNSFRGELPEELGRLTRLQHINLTYNSLGGKIPTNLTNCKELTVLDLAINYLNREIPNQLSSLTKLVLLGFGGNNLTGTIPPWIGNFSSLSKISLAVNNLQGSIPKEVGQLSGLGVFQVYGNFLSGTIPSSIFNISSMYYFSVALNELHGQLPPDVGLRFPGLEVFAGGVNNFTGPIPVSFSNASGLQVLDFAQNGLTGPIPTNLGSLKSLVRFNFDENNIGSGVVGDLDFLIGSLVNCTNLEVLGLAQNNFAGKLPSYIANLSTQLQIFTIGRNLIHDSIPDGIGNLVNLNSLGLEGNYLSGYVPDVIGRLERLQGLNLNVNRFSGSIPSSIGNLSRLTRLFMEENRFEGSIPASLGNCKNLQNLNLSSNNLNGTIPKEVLRLSSLTIALVMSNNSLTGSLPSEVGNLQNLMELDVSGNKLSGEIPSTLGSCTSLERLHLERNDFEGPISESLSTLRGIAELDLSENNLTGKIPEFLSNLLTLRLLNLSYNDFQGQVPTEGIFANASAVSMIGNDNLCGGIPELHFPMCSITRHSKLARSKVVIIAIAAAFISAVFCSFAILCAVRQSSRHSNAPPPEEQQVGMSHSELMISTNGFAAENLIGSGSFGSVYKGILPGEERMVAIKVLNHQQKGALKSFFDECNALQSIRHRNLLRIITACSTVDHHGNDFKGLVFEFMSNGSLDQWLHPTTDEQYRTKKLSLIQRLNISIDVASALEYLHHHCDTPIVHCDLKPSNVLLDDDMTAHVGDFGLAKFLFEGTKNPFKTQTVSVSLKGSIGYIPPEYGLGGEVSILGDVYSYGILLLEMFTGKRPTDEMFKDDLSIHKFVDTALPEQVMAIIDPSMRVEVENHEDAMNEHEAEERPMIRDNDSKIDGIGEVEECVASVFRVGLSCSAKSPGKRMAMNFVVNKLHGIRDSFLRSTNRKR